MSFLIPSSRGLLSKLLGHFLAFTYTASYIDAAAAAAPSAVAANVGIENDVLHFSYELERSWLDADKRPCQNFFDFVCGRSFNGSDAQMLAQRQKQTQQQKFERFLATKNDEQLMDAELKLKLFYISCKEARSLEDLKSTLMYRSAGGWPAIDDSASMIRKRRNITWLGVLSAFHDAGFEYFFSTRVEIKSNKRVVLVEPDATMRFTLRKFEQLTSDVLEESAVDGGRARLVALEIMNFERIRREIAKVQQQSVEQPQELTYANFKLAFLGSATEIEWDAYFKRTVGKALKPSDMVQVRQLNKLRQYFEFLQNTTMTRFLNWIWIDYLMDKNITDCQTLTQHYFEPVYQHIVERTSIDQMQMAQMYTDLMQSYESLLPPSVWIDEMSHQRSKQFHGRVMHLTLNDDAQLDIDLAELTITRRNFYRNLEKMQNHLMQQQKMVAQQQQQQQFNSVTSHSHEVSQAASEFMKIFLTVGGVLEQHNLTMPLNYVLVGEHFATLMIASGGSSTTPGAWRSMDSEREYSTFKQCLSRQMADGVGVASAYNSTLNYNPNDLLLHILSQRQTLNALNSWQSKNAALWNRLDRLLSAGRLQLTLRKLYFISALLANCHADHSGIGGTGMGSSNVIEQQRHFVHSYLRNSQEFSRTFGCRIGDELYARSTCRVL